jgi:hypothetical protein
MAVATDYLSSYLQPLAEELTPQQAQKILAIEPTPTLVERVVKLADKANEGQLTAEERAEYEYYIDVDDVIGLLKVKARQVLNGR